MTDTIENSKSHKKCDIIQQHIDS